MIFSIQKLVNISLNIVQVALLTLYYSFVAALMKLIFVYENPTKVSLFCFSLASILSFLSYYAIEKELNRFSDKLLAQDFFASFFVITLFYFLYYDNGFLLASFLIAFIAFYFKKKELAKKHFFKMLFIGGIALTLLEIKVFVLPVFLILYLALALFLKKKNYGFKMYELFSLRDFLVVLFVSIVANSCSY